MKLIKRIRNLSVNVKTIGIFLIGFAILFTVLVAIMTRVTQELTEQLSRQRIELEVKSIQLNVQKTVHDLSSNGLILANVAGVVDGVSQNDTDAIRTNLLVTRSIDNVDQIHVFNAKKERLLTLSNTSAIPDDVIQADMISLATIGVSFTELIPSSNTEGEPIVLILAGTPILARNGDVVGVIVLTRSFDEKVLASLNTDSDRADLQLIYDGKQIATTSDEALAFNTNTARTNLAQALAGDTVINNELTLGSDGETEAVAFIPVIIGKNIQTVIRVDIDSTDLVTFQQNILRDSLLTLAIFALILSSIMIAFLRLNVLRPLQNLTQAATVLAKGNYSQRVPINSSDELGQLSASFNQMVDAVEENINSAQEARKKAEHADHVKSAFLASMSHELRTPLNAVINFTKFMAKGRLGPVNKEQEETLYEVVDSAKHLLNLINDVLDMSKIESGSLNLFIKDQVDLKGIIDQTISTGKILIADKPVEIRKDVSEDLPYIRADHQRLVQIMLNIISNACKFTKEGSITVKAYQESQQVVISVTDTGPGIDLKDQDAVFEAFKQTDSGLRQGGGTGLGMPITKSLVEAHGGCLTLISQVNAGATFTITLPIASDELVPMLP